MISEQEAQQAVIALGTAMIHDDKEGREAIYADMDVDDLKRIIRWTMRQNLSHFATLAMLSGKDPLQAWSEFAMAMTIISSEQEED